MNKKSQGFGARVKIVVSQKKVVLFNVGMLLVLVAVGILAFCQGISRMEKTYHDAEENAYNSIYQAAFDYAEAKNHVSNRVSIAIESEREVSRLEVLTVSTSGFVIKNKDETDPTTSWLEVQGTGVFTVDLTVSEFITDSDRKYVLVRIPRPVLTNLRTSPTGTEFWNDGRIFTNGSIAEGVKLSQKQLAQGRIQLEDSIKQNRNFYEHAKNSAKRMIESLVKSWNPNIPDLQVDVEFMENP